MQPEFGFICVSACRERGAWSVRGIHTSVFPSSVPYRHNPVVLYLRVKMKPDEVWPERGAFTLELLDPYGEKSQWWTMNFSLHRPEDPEVGTVDVPIELKEITLSHYGTYLFKLSLGRGVPSLEVPLVVGYLPEGLDAPQPST